MKLSLKLTFGATIWLIKRNIKTILLFSLFYCMVTYLYLYGTAYFSQPSLQFTPSHTPSQFAIPPFHDTYTPPINALPLILSIVSNILYSIGSLLGCYLFVIIIVSRDITPPVPFIRQLRYVLGRLVPLYLTALFYSVIVGVGTFFFIIPGIIFAIKYSQAVFFAVVDGDNQSNAFKHSAEITKGNYLRLIRQAFVVGILYLVFLLPVLFLPIPSFIKVFYYFCIFFIGELVNYSTWKILKQGYSSGQVQLSPTSLWRKIYITALVLFILFMLGIAIKSLASSNNRFNKLLNISDRIKSVTPSPSPSQSPTPLPNPTLTPSPTDIPYPTPALIDLRETKEWQTYTNKSYGYSIRYPLDFIIQSLDSEPNIVKSLNVAVRSVDGKKYIAISAEDGSVDKKIREYGPLFLETEMSIPENDTTVMSTEGNASE
ncbi:MAG: hypothetical protein NTV98_05100, partial [Candidatus Roizmanbacteria bacterium]|nr:hypothetical protein [Candidatus Roizmanbacteria bacterium]